MSCSTFVQNVLGHPRSVLGMFAVLMFVVAIGTEMASPNYIMFPWMSSTTATLAGLACIWALARPSMWSLAFAGAGIAGAIAARGFGISMQLMLTPWEGDRSITLLIGDVAWVTILSMLPSVWSKHLIPWGVARVLVAEE